MLSTPAPRNPLHTREITFQGYARENGLWDIEAHLRDFKFQPFITGGKYAIVVYGDDIETAPKWGNFICWLGGIRPAETRNVNK